MTNPLTVSEIRNFHRRFVNVVVSQIGSYQNESYAGKLYYSDSCSGFVFMLVKDTSSVVECRCLSLHSAEIKSAWLMSGGEVQTVGVSDDEELDYWLLNSGYNAGVLRTIYGINPSVLTGNIKHDLFSQQMPSQNAQWYNFCNDNKDCGSCSDTGCTEKEEEVEPACNMCKYWSLLNGICNKGNAFDLSCFEKI